MAKIVSVGVANPEYSYTQREVYERLGYNSSKVWEVFLNSKISKRHFCISKDERFFYNSLHKDNQRYIIDSVKVGKAAVIDCLAKAKLKIRDVDLVISCSSTGYACPGLSSYLCKELGADRAIQKLDVNGLGCSGALQSLQRANDYVVANPLKMAILVNIELCSLTCYVDETMETAVANALFADGASAVLVKDSHSEMMPKIIDFSSFMFPEFIDIMGFKQRGGRLRVVLSDKIPLVLYENIAAFVTKLLNKNHLSKGDIKHWIVHPGGKRILEVIGHALSLSKDQLRHSWKILDQYGNMSSPSIMFVLNEVLKQADVRSGDYGLMLAVGPGLSLEGVLLKW